MDNTNGHVMNLANSIIGVSILAMPYCFKQCGIILSIMMLLISSVISRLACHFLLKSAIVSRRKTFEFLAFHIFGSMGKLAIEIGMIGFLLGTCIAFFVVMGDLAPEIISEMTGASTTSTMRTSILMALALFCVLPLGLLRNVDSLNGVSRATIGFYCCLVLKVVFEATPHIVTGDWYKTVNFWRPDGILQCLPIFSMALFCQSQLFEIYQAVPNATLDKMNNLVRIAVNICTSVYILVGTFGYIAFAKGTFTGNILLSFSPSFMTDVMKIGFVLSVAFSFPLVIFPCRASLYSLIYKEGYLLHEGVSNYIPEGKFKGLTMIIVFISLIVGILIPNIELVLGLIGSTIGVMICVLFPVTCFICISPKNTNERILAQLMLMIGVFVMVLGTYKNLHSLDNVEANVVTITSLRGFDQAKSNIQVEINANKISSTKKIEVKTDAILKSTEDSLLKEVRHEPPQPIEPVEDLDKEKKKRDESQPKIKKKVKNDSPEVAGTSPPLKKTSVTSILKKSSKNEEVDIEAIRKEDKEVEQQEKERVMEEDKNHQMLIDTIQKQHEVQKEVLEQQKKLIEVIQNQQKQKDDEEVHKVNEEKMKAVKEIQDIAKKAIEKISGKDDDQVVKDFEEEIKKIEETEVQPAVTKSEHSDQDIPHAESLKDFKKADNEVDNVEIENSPLNKILGKEKMADKETDNRPAEELPKAKKLNANILNLKPNIGSVLSENVNNVNSPAVQNQIKNRDGEIILEKTVSPIIQNNLGVANNVISQRPLILKIGDAHVKISDDQDPQKLLPLPIAMSKNLEQADSNNLLAENAKNLENKSNDAEVKAMRRDILNYS